MDLKEISLAVQKGKRKDVKALVEQALSEGMEVQDILDNGLISAMNVVGEDFKNNKIYVPEMLMSARAMTAGVDILSPLMSQSGVKAIGTVVIGTVKGDLHDIGKNLVAMMMRGKGITVYDVGTDAPPERFIEKAKEVNADIICLSALLTTTMPAITDVLDALKADGSREKYYVMIGGAPVTQAFADQVGADAYTADAATAAEVAESYLSNK
ncbi:MAG: cobalamin-binding protein [Lachnospiraceae bacterium]|nr:cobalamin-binding protein [Lachnospiraceae bacterium]